MPAVEDQSQCAVGEKAIARVGRWSGSLDGRRGQPDERVETKLPDLAERLGEDPAAGLRFRAPDRRQRAVAAGAGDAT